MHRPGKATASGRPCDPARCGAHAVAGRISKPVQSIQVKPGLLLQSLLPLVDKANLAPIRLVSFLALAITAGHLMRRDNRLLHTPVARLIIRCGQHSLQVFCLGVLLAVLGEILLTSVRDDIVMQIAISVAGIVLMIAISGLLTWYKEGTAMRSDAVIAAETNAYAVNR